MAALALLGCGADDADDAAASCAEGPWGALLEEWALAPAAGRQGEGPLLARGG